MIGPFGTKLLTNAASIYLHRWIAHCTTANLHEMPCCNTFAGECHSQKCGCIAWHWTKIIKIYHVSVGLWMTKVTSSQYGQNYQKHHKNANNWNTAPVKGFVLTTVVHAKNTTFRVQSYATANGILKLDLFTVYVWWLLLYCKLTKHHIMVIWDSQFFVINFFWRCILTDIEFYTMLTWFWVF